MGVEAALYARLSGYSALTSLLSSAEAIYPVVASQDASQPYLVYTIISDVPTAAMGSNVEPNDVLLDVSAVAGDYEACVAISAQVHNALDRYSGTVAGVVIQATYRDGGPADVFDPDRKYYQRTLDFRVHYEA